MSRYIYNRSWISRNELNDHPPGRSEERCATKHDERRDSVQKNGNTAYGQRTRVEMSERIGFIVSKRSPQTYSVNFACHESVFFSSSPPPPPVPQLILTKRSRSCKVLFSDDEIKEFNNNLNKLLVSRICKILNLSLLTLTVSLTASNV